MTWTEQAACKGMDPAIHHPNVDVRPSSPRAAGREAFREAYAQARLVCASCPVAGECLAYAIDNGENDGMWGGMDPRERWELVGMRARCRCGRVFSYRGAKRRHCSDECRREAVRLQKVAYDESRGQVRHRRNVSPFGEPGPASPVDWSVVPDFDDPRERAAGSVLEDSYFLGAVG